MGDGEGVRRGQGFAQLPSREGIAAARMSRESRSLLSRGEAFLEEDLGLLVAPRLIESRALATRWRSRVRKVEHSSGAQQTNAASQKPIAHEVKRTRLFSALATSRWDSP